MTIYLGADHGGFERKQELLSWLSEQKIDSKDCGAFELDPHDDYPAIARAVSMQVKQDPQSKGILLCRSGAGMCIVANRFAGIRAVEAWDETSAIHSREHNDANVLCLSGDWMSLDEMKNIIQVWLGTSFSDLPQHQRRILQIDEARVE